LICANNQIFNQKLVKGIKQSMRGGYRKNAGRKPTVSGRDQRERTKKQREIQIRALRDGTSPLEVILEAMKEKYEAEGAEAASALAAMAAPYIHPRLANVDSNLTMNNAKPADVTADALPQEDWDKAYGHGGNGIARPN
jgi:hypothetical protein